MSTKSSNLSFSKTSPASPLIAVDKNPPTTWRGKSLPDPSPSGEEVLLDLDGGLVLDLEVEQLDPKPFQLNSIGPHLEKEPFIQFRQNSPSKKFRSDVSFQIYPIRLVVTTASVKKVGHPHVGQILGVFCCHLVAN